jgi:Zinc finger, C3HC4 type (RING finger)
MTSIVHIKVRSYSVSVDEETRTVREKAFEMASETIESNMHVLPETTEIDVLAEAEDAEDEATHHRDGVGTPRSMLVSYATRQQDHKSMWRLLLRADHERHSGTVITKGVQHLLAQWHLDLGRLAAAESRMIINASVNGAVETMHKMVVGSNTFDCGAAPTALLQLMDVPISGNSRGQTQIALCAMVNKLQRLNKRHKNWQQLKNFDKHIEQLALGGKAKCTASAWAATVGAMKNTAVCWKYQTKVAEAAERAAFRDDFRRTAQLWTVLLLCVVWWSGLRKWRLYSMPCRIVPLPLEQSLKRSLLLVLSAALFWAELCGFALLLVERLKAAAAVKCVAAISDCEPDTRAYYVTLLSECVLILLVDRLPLWALSGLRWLLSLADLTLLKLAAKLNMPKLASLCVRSEAAVTYRCAKQHRTAASTTCSRVVAAFTLQGSAAAVAAVAVRRSSSVQSKGTLIDSSVVYTAAMKGWDTVLVLRLLYAWLQSLQGRRASVLAVVLKSKDYTAVRAILRVYELCDTRCDGYSSDESDADSEHACTLSSTTMSQQRDSWLAKWVIALCGLQTATNRCSMADCKLVLTAVAAVKVAVNGPYSSTRGTKTMQGYMEARHTRVERVSARSSRAHARIKQTPAEAIPELQAAVTVTVPAAAATLWQKVLALSISAAHCVHRRKPTASSARSRCVTTVSRKSSGSDIYTKAIDSSAAGAAVATEETAAAVAAVKAAPAASSVAAPAATAAVSAVSPATAAAAAVVAATGDNCSPLSAAMSALQAAESVQSAVLHKLRDKKATDKSRGSSCEADVQLLGTLLLSLSSSLNKLKGAFRSQRAQRKELSKQHDAALQQCRNEAAAAAVAAAVRLKAVTTRLQELEERTVCVVCQSEPKAVLLQPCLHLYSCIKCSVSPKIAECPLCRAAIDYKETVHLG